MALYKFQKRYKNLLALKKLAKLLLILFFLGNAIFIAKHFISYTKSKNVASKVEKNNSNPGPIAQDTILRELTPKLTGVYVDKIIRLPYKLKIITAEKWKIILNPQKDLEKQLKAVGELLNKMQSKQRKKLEYIGVDVEGQIYYKLK